MGTTIKASAIVAVFLFGSLLSSVNILASGSNLEGKSDWAMFQYNPQHTGYNDKDSITVPLKLLWQKRFTEELCPLEPVTAIGDRIIVTNQYFCLEQSTHHNPTVRCVDARDGTVLWSNEFYHTELYAFDQPSYHDGYLYLMENYHDDSRIAVYDLESGEVIKWYLYYAQWDDQLGSIIHNGKLFFATGYYNGMSCVDIATDSMDWWTVLYNIDRWSPAAHDTTAYFWSGAVSAFNINTGERMWFLFPEWEIHYDTSSSKSTGWSNFHKASKTPVIDTTNQMLYLLYGDGFYGVNYDTHEIHWYYDWGHKDSLNPVAPAAYDGKVYAYFSRYYLVAFDGVTGEKLLRYKLDTLSFYPPVIANGLIFASTDNKTVALDIDTFEKVWEYPAAGYLTIANNRLFIASHTGDMYVFEPVAPVFVDESPESVPREFELLQNYPNPFNPTTNISFTLSRGGDVKLVVYNLLGEQVTTLLDKKISPGKHSFQWNGKDNLGRKVTSGVYFYELSTGGLSDTRKMLLLK